MYVTVYEINNSCALGQIFRRGHKFRVIPGFIPKSTMQSAHVLGQSVEKRSSS